MIAPVSSTTTRNRLCAEKKVRRCRPESASIPRSDPARAHLFLQQGGGEAEALGDDGSVDLHGAIFEFDRFHMLHLMRCCGGHACAGLGLAVAR
jgi:hypothetical protein